jgi:cation:H+ antiporter
LSILIYKKIKGEKEKILFLGGSATLASILAISMLQKGFLSRIDGFLLILSYLILIYFIRVAVKREYFKVELVEDAVYKTRLKEYIWQTGYSLAGIVVGSVIAVFMIIEISKIAGIAEFTLSFAFMGFTTSFPELIICLAALRDKEYGIAVGDIFGSNIADVTLSMGVGATLAPNVFSGAAPIWSGFYLIAITGIITLIFARKEKMERKEAVLLIILYILAYPLLLI